MEAQFLGMLWIQLFCFCFSVLQGKTTLELKGENDPGLREVEADSDCNSDRAAALEEQKASPPLFLFNILILFYNNLVHI